MIFAPEVRWTSDTDGLNDWRVLHPAPSENLGFSEKGHYLFQKPGADYSLYVDDEPLLDQPSKPSSWIWEPRFFAGEVTAEMLRADGTTSALFLLDVAPDANKIGREIFSQMVNELWREDPALVIGSEPATTPSGELGTQEDPWAAFARLRRYGPDFVRAFASIRARPRRSLRYRRDSLPLHQVRRVDRQTASALLRSPAIGLFVPDADELPALMQNTRLDVPCGEETVDSAANRAMLALVLALLRRTRSLAERLQGLVERETLNETRTSLALRWPKRKRFLENVAAQLKLLLRLDPFSKVQRAEITAAGLTAIAADPVYSRAWSRGWRALRHGVDFSTNTERLWISPSWEIYERWCFLRLGNLFAARMPAWGWHRLADRWVGAYNDSRAELLLQPKFPANNPGPGKMWSISRLRVPDFVLKVERAGDLRFLVLDAKYRTSRASVLDAMESAHIYQDSLRIGSRRPDGSLLIVPSSGGAGWLENPAFQEEHRVGIHVISPEIEASLPSLVAGFLGDSRSVL
jgi:hypothetical protein